MAKGLKVAQQFKNVQTASDKELSYSSQFKTFSIFKSGQLDQTGTGGTKTFTIKHGLGFIPYVFVYYKTSALPTYWRFCPQIVGLIDANNSNVSSNNIRVNKENLIIIVVLGNGANETISIKYLIFNYPIALSI